MEVAIVAVLADDGQVNDGERSYFDDSKKAWASSSLSMLDPRPSVGAAREY